MKLRTLATISVGCALVVLLLRSLASGGTEPGFDVPGHAAAADRIAPPPIAPAEYRRPEDNTYLTIPEWYLVWSSDEYAAFIADRPPSRFPYFAHLGQFWSGYRIVYDSISGRYPFNAGYHLMIAVIGASTSAEYGIKACYEKLVGRVTEAAGFGARTAEDSLAETTMQSYVKFIRVEPWYRFDFLAPLKGLWTRTGFIGGDPLRKWERKYFLTSEYAAKAAYGWLLKQAAGAVYEEEKEVTAVVLDRLPAISTDSMPEFHPLRSQAGGEVLCTLPRYQAFTDYARMLARSGVNILEIAGNTGDILLSAIVPEGYDDSGLRILMRQPLATKPGLQRIVMAMPVRELAGTIRRVDHPPLVIEHVYDY
ncbi:MAG: hypothetical protein JST22_18850 [Bacteroidetes bacterium]|nr:hypothetical protein [Bacteroidota bacterium]